MAEVTALLPSRRRVEAFARALDGEPAPADAKALTTLVAALEAMPTARAAEPSADFRDRLRETLVTEAARTAQPGGSGRHRVGGPSPAPSEDPDGGALRRLAAKRRAVAVAAALSIGLGLGGAGVASASALPGDSLYGMKRATESLRLAIAGSDLDHARLELAFAARRLDEIEAMTGSPQGLAGGSARPATDGLSPEQRAEVHDAMTDWRSSVQAGAGTLIDVHEQQGTVQPLTELDTFARDQDSRLNALLPALPGALRADAQEGIDLVRDLRERAVRLLATADNPTAGADEACSGEECGSNGAPGADNASAAPSPTSPDDASGGSGTAGGPLPDSTGDASGTGDVNELVPGDEPDAPTSPSTGTSGPDGLQETVNRIGQRLGDTADDTTSGVGDTVDNTTDGLDTTLDQTTDGLTGN
ncbi:MAG: DUF5667 domain-containing protein [Actinomycetes bacterium]